MGRRNLIISFLVAALILAVGGFLFQCSGAGIQITVVVAFGVSQSLLFVLDDRERNRAQRRR
jgi:hypothetical protein